MIIDCISEYKKILKDGSKPTFLDDLILSDSIDKFKITKHRDGNYPAIITISGWRSEGKDNRKEWEESILFAYPDREWFHLEWKSNKLPFVDNDPMTTMPNVYETKKNNKEIYINKIKSLIFTLIPQTRVFIAFDILINNYWHGAVKNSRITGACLAKVLSACHKKEFILIGHSLGARVIYNCLKHLDEKSENLNIVEAHFLGGAVGSNAKLWLPISSKVKNNIYNYFSDNDDVLKRAYRIAMQNKSPIGLTHIVNEKVINTNTTEIITGHTEYIKNFHIIKKKQIIC